jgi:predicted homoserine dehydrogenase-like protein
VIYRHLFDRLPAEKTVRAGVIGTGQYATAVITQSPAIPRLDVPIAADLDVEAARQAFLSAGYGKDDIAICATREAALAAIEHGQRAVVGDAMLLMDLPLDVIVESTGVPEAGAAHAAEAIRQGKHVAMVNKEADVTVGPILKHLAGRAGLVYTAVDGDQHGLLMGLSDWARALGLEVLCGGKFRNGEVVYDVAAGTVSGAGRTISLSAGGLEALRPIAPGRAARVVSARRDALGDMAHEHGSALVEMAIAANATGLLPDIETLHHPVLRAVEIPEVMCPTEHGGILGRRGAIDTVICLRHPDEAGLGGGVYIVVACENDYSRHILTTKGLLPNSRGSTALIYRPYHLCGVETATSILCAGLLGLPTGGAELLPRVDVVARAATGLKAGDRIGGDNSPDLQVLMRPAEPVRGGAPLPLHMAHGNALAVDVPAGTVITGEMVVPPPASVLWSLRAQQDAHFGQV